MTPNSSGRDLERFISDSSSERVRSRVRDCINPEENSEIDFEQLRHSSWFQMKIRLSKSVAVQSKKRTKKCRHALTKSGSGALCNFEDAKMSSRPKAMFWRSVLLFQAPKRACRGHRSHFFPLLMKARRFLFRSAFHPPRKHVTKNDSGENEMRAQQQHT